MSRRITFFALAATAALIATPASADPECFGDTCILPGVTERAAPVAPSPDTDDNAAPQASAAVEKLAPQSSAAVEKLAQAKALPQVIAEPVMREPVPPIQSLADEAGAPHEPARLARREPVRLAPRYLKAAPVPVVTPVPIPAPARVAAADVAQAELARPSADYVRPPANHARSVRVSSSEPAYTVGYTGAPAGGVVVVVPGALYNPGRSVYMFAPNAKIISINSDD